MKEEKSIAEKLKEFKVKFTKEKIEEFFESLQRAINFFEIQLSKAKYDQKEYSKRFAKGSFIDVAMSKTTENYPEIKNLFKKLETDITAELNLHLELLEMKIAYLKSLK